MGGWVDGWVGGWMDGWTDVVIIPFYNSCTALCRRSLKQPKYVAAGSITKCVSTCTHILVSHVKI